MKRLLLLALAVLAVAVPASAQIIIPYTFVFETTIDQDQVNSNFTTIGNAALNRTGGTVTGAIASSGGSLTGSWDGSPTFTGDLTFSGDPTFSGAPAFSGTVDCKSCTYFDSYAAKSATFTAAATDAFVACDATSGAVTANLPAAATAGAGRLYTLKKIDSSANACIWDGDGSETIDGGATVSITAQYDSLTIISTGSAWLIK
jgi:hypothetical protein